MLYTRSFVFVVRMTAPNAEPITRAAIYCRISADRIGAGLGVRRQTEDCQDLAAGRGWSVVGVYEDNDVSAYGARHRPGYQALLKAVVEGQVDIVVAWHTDRLHRSPRELEEWISVCDPRGVGVVTVRAGELDLSTAAGRMTARIVGAVARHESEQKSERIARKHRELALAGKPSGSMRAFGHNSDGTLVDAEAAVVREIVPRVLAGESLKSVTRWLADNEVPTVRGGAWRTATVRQLLTAARLSGQREWTPRTPPRGAPDGTPRRGYGMGEIVADAVWPAIITKTETARLRALLGDPARRTTPRGRPVAYLLSGGIARCGRCQGPMNNRSDSTTGRRYACIKHLGTTRCGAMSVVADPVDRLVTAMLFDALAGVDLKRRETPGARQPLSDDAEEIQVIIDKAQERLTSLAQDYGNDLITRSEYLSARQAAEGRLRQGQLRQTTTARTATLEDVPNDPAALANAWDTWPLERRRAVLTAVIEEVTIRPAEQLGRPTFNPDRVTIIWRV